MKTSNIEPSGQRSAAATRGSRSTNLAGSKGIVFRDPVTESVGQLRDITLQGITLTDNDDGTGVLTVAAGGGTGTPPWFNVIDYGAVGDGVTVDCAAINAAIAAINLNGRGVLYFPFGTYLCDTGLTAITAPCTIRGDGWQTGASGPVSQIEFDNTTGTLFTFTANGILVRDLAVLQTGGTATAGAAFDVNGGTLFDFDHVLIDGFWIGIDVESSSAWAARRCYISSFQKYGIKINNNAAPDTGDWVVMGCTFGTSGAPADAGIRIESSGGGRIFSNKFNAGATGTSRADYGIDVAIGTGDSTSVLNIFGNSIENVTTDAIRIVTTGSGLYSLINIVGNQCGLYGNDTGRAVLLNGVGASLVNIANNIWTTNGTARAAVSVTDSTSVHIGPNIINTFNAEYTNSGGRLIDSRGYRVHHVYPTGYTPSGLVTGGNIGINGGTVAQQIVIPHLMILDTLRYKNLDTATARAIEFGLFQDEGSANAMCIAKGSDSFTPVAASNRTPQWTSAPITVYPGVYWFVVRNTGGATNFQFSFLVANATTNIGLVQIQSKTLAGALPAVGATLDLSGSWTRTSLNSMAFALIGRVFGEGSAF